MKNTIPRNPVRLVQFLDNLMTGDDKHQNDKPLPKEDRTALQATRDKLASLNGTAQTSRGQLRQATADRRDYLETAREEADKYRAAVVHLHGSKGAALVDYGLVTRRKPRKAGSVAAVGASPEDSKVSKAKVHLAKMQEQLERAKKRTTSLEERIARKTAEVANAPAATPSEPTTSSEPTSESGTK